MSLCYKRVLPYIYIMTYVSGGAGGLRLVCKDTKYGGHVIHTLLQ